MKRGLVEVGSTLWSADTKINLFAVDMGKICNNNCTVLTVKCRGANVLIRGLSAKGVGQMAFIDDTMNAGLCTQTLNEKMAPTLEEKK